LEIKLIKVGKVPATGHRGWCALVRKRWKAAGRKPWFLLNLLYAKEAWKFENWKVVEVIGFE